MSDLTVYAEELIRTVARAFYDDDAICLIDILIRDKYLRDDDMSQRLTMPAKKLRSTLQFLQDEFLVSSDEVDDLADGGSQQTKFWYVDYNRACHTIRLRLHLLRKELEADERSSRGSSVYKCPGHDQRRCNGRYTEEEAQQMVDMNSGAFLCQECHMNYKNNPNGPNVDTYTLCLVDNTAGLKLAVDNIRRVNVQLSGKMIGGEQIRTGVYDLLQKVRGKGKEPITSNLPGENYSRNEGSKRIKGTGRTAGLKKKKELEQQCVTTKSAEKKLLGGGGCKQGFQSDLTFLKNAMGEGVHFCIEKGGSARANLLSQQNLNPRRKKRKLLDAAATRVGASVSLVEQHEVAEHNLRQQQKNQEEEKFEFDCAKKEKGEDYYNGKKNSRSDPKRPDGLPGTTGMHWLKDNISRGALDREMEKLRKQDIEQELLIAAAAEEECFQNSQPTVIVLSDFINSAEQASCFWVENIRKASFQSLYKKEIGRQSKLLHLPEYNEIAGNLSSPPKGVLVGDTNGIDEKSIDWVDG